MQGGQNYSSSDRTIFRDLTDKSTMLYTLSVIMGAVVGGEIGRAHV